MRWRSGTARPDGRIPHGSSSEVADRSVTVTHSKTWGPVLTLSNGETLYRLTRGPGEQERL